MAANTRLLISINDCEMNNNFLDLMFWPIIVYNPYFDTVWEFAAKRILHVNYCGFLKIHPMFLLKYLKQGDMEFFLNFN